MASSVCMERLEDFNLKHTRSGRLCVPPLAYWTGERLVTPLNDKKPSKYVAATNLKSHCLFPDNMLEKNKRASRFSRFLKDSKLDKSSQNVTKKKYADVTLKDSRTKKPVKQSPSFKLETIDTTRFYHTLSRHPEAQANHGSSPLALNLRVIPDLRKAERISLPKKEKIKSNISSRKEKTKSERSRKNAKEHSQSCGAARRSERSLAVRKRLMNESTCSENEKSFSISRQEDSSKPKVHRNTLRQCLTKNSIRRMEAVETCEESEEESHILRSRSRVQLSNGSRNTITTRAKGNLNDSVRSKAILQDSNKDASTQCLNSQIKKSFKKLLSNQSHVNCELPAVILPNDDEQVNKKILNGGKKKLTDCRGRSRSKRFKRIKCFSSSENELPNCHECVKPKKSSSGNSNSIIPLKSDTSLSELCLVSDLNFGEISPGKMRQQRIQNSSKVDDISDMDIRLRFNGAFQDLFPGSKQQPSNHGDHFVNEDEQWALKPSDVPEEEFSLDENILGQVSKSMPMHGLRKSMRLEMQKKTEPESRHRLHSSDKNTTCFSVNNLSPQKGDHNCGSNADCEKDCGFPQKRAVVQLRRFSERIAQEMSTDSRLIKQYIHLKSPLRSDEDTSVSDLSFGFGSPRSQATFLGANKNEMPVSKVIPKSKGRHSESSNVNTETVSSLSSTKSLSIGKETEKKNRPAKNNLNSSSRQDSHMASDKASKRLTFKNSKSKPSESSKQLLGASGDSETDDPEIRLCPGEMSIKQFSFLSKSQTTNSSSDFPPTPGDRIGKRLFKEDSEYLEASNSKLNSTYTLQTSGFHGRNESKSPIKNNKSDAPQIRKELSLSNVSNSENIIRTPGEKVTEKMLDENLVRKTSRGRKILKTPVYRDARAFKKKVPSSKVQPKKRVVRKPDLESFICRAGEKNPGKGTLKRKKYLCDKLEEFNKDHDDDIFENKEVFNLKSILTLENILDNKVVNLNFGTPKQTFEVTSPMITVKTPDTKSVPTPSEFNCDRNNANAYMYRRDKLNKAKQAQRQSSPVKSSPESEQTRTDLAEAAKNLNRIFNQLETSKLNDNLSDDESKDYYYSDAEDSDLVLRNY